MLPALERLSVRAPTHCGGLASTTRNTCEILGVQVLYNQVTFEGIWINGIKSRTRWSQMILVTAQETRQITWGRAESGNQKVGIQLVKGQFMDQRG